MDFASLLPLLDQAIQSRLADQTASNPTLGGISHEEAYRLFNGFYEGYPHLVLDVYARTLVIHDYADPPSHELIQSVIQHLLHNIHAPLSWIRTIVLKTRNGISPEEKRGTVIFGDHPDNKFREHGIWYAANLTMNRDTGFYLDTANLRKWLIENSRGKSVLNTFAYTGSLGVAAIAGGASQVVQTDMDRKSLNIAKDSYALNGFPIRRQDFIAQDFFHAVARFKSSGQTFDCVIIDPPFFSTTPRGRVDQEHESERIINKVRPLVNDGGVLIAVNNAVFLSGTDYISTLEALCADGYLSIRKLIPVPENFIGFRRVGKPVTDPAPFNHSTKIAILDVRRK